MDRASSVGRSLKLAFERPIELRERGAVKGKVDNYSESCGVRMNIVCVLDHQLFRIVTGKWLL